MASILLLSTTLLYTTLVSAQCPYPCNPPPTAGGGNTNTPPSTTMPPPATPTGNNNNNNNNYYYYSPPAGIYTPPSNVFPYNPPTPDFYGGAPPAPDPIVPWFPFYYKDPPRNPSKSSSADVKSGSTAVIFLVHVVMFVQMMLY